MGIVEWATSPWGRDVPIHVAWSLIYIALTTALAFLVAHATYVRYFARRREFAEGASPDIAVTLPSRIPRHSRTARAFHWVMAASMLTLLLTAFLPKVGVQFDWIAYHWIAGIVLTASIVFHVIHATFWLDFWSIWPDRADLQDAYRRARRFVGLSAPPPRKFAKYPLDNKLYHGAIIVTGLTAIGTGLVMLGRVRTTLLTRNPYAFADMTWGWIYASHGLAGVGLIALVVIHIYFAIRPEKRAITKSMIFGTMSRDFYLEEHDPERWRVRPSSRLRSRG